ncbi:ergothioneine biosynthesis protein EgtC [Pilimelia columellifera]|uniref:Gamma-glutamyl-hercynylcysteine sulfoxide hydrolase n=1 Tax=Pilimelia columellifera subsp. columellifera TaxID=706583 RepID=A0ABP6AWJ4_9ACTN
MCRHLVYLGPPRPLATTLFDAPHSLSRQSWAPRDMRGGGTINADGFGLAWYPAPGADPVRYRRDVPLWSDADLPSLAGATATGAFLAAVRSATEGMPVVATAAAPFVTGRWSFSHNGVVAGWPDSMVASAAGLPVRDLLTLEAPSDAALLWALVRHRLRAGDEPGRALAGAVARVLADAPGSRLNLLLTDGVNAYATTCGHALSAWSDGAATLLASEPLDDDPRWRPVPDGALARAGAGTVNITSLLSEEIS